MGRPEDLLQSLADHLSAHAGWYYPKARQQDLARGIAHAARDLGFEDLETCSESLLAAPPTREQLEILSAHLCIGETYFFRDRRSLEALETHILADLVQSRRAGTRSLRIWSAGCCTGEEPYTIAMLLRRMIPDLEDWRVTLLGTDINPRFLQKASEGVYGEWSFRGTPSWIQDGYFAKLANGRWEVLPRIRSMVKFSPLNLAEDSYPSVENGTGEMDVILCRNVLMYFSPQQVAAVLARLHRSLVNGGWLLVGSSETSQVAFEGLTPVALPGGLVHRKSDGQGRIAAPLDRWFDVADEARPEVALADALVETSAPADDVLEFPRPDPPVASREVRGLSDDYARGAALYSQHRYVEAISVLSAWLPAHTAGCEACPLHVSAASLLGRAHANLGDLAGAQAWCQTAIDLEVLDPRSHYLLATILQEGGQLQAAAVSLQRALYLDPNFVMAHFALGNVRSRQSQRAESRRCLQNALRLLKACARDQSVPESEEITAGGLAEVIASIIHMETLA